MDAAHSNSEIHQADAMNIKESVPTAAHLTRTELALRYLFTTGAKALVLMDKGQSKEMLLNTLNEEMEAKKEMQLEEQTKAFKCSMHLPPGVLVKKRGRNGVERNVYIMYQKDSSAPGFGIAWQSVRGFKKYFDMSGMTHCVDVTNDGANDGFIRLENSSRYLELKFSKEIEPAFLHYLQSQRLHH
jgi:hypothetical protein